MAPADVIGLGMAGEVLPNPPKVTVAPLGVAAVVPVVGGPTEDPAAGLPALRSALWVSLPTAGSCT
jgi:hypothetical protein